MIKRPSLQAILGLTLALTYSGCSTKAPSYFPDGHGVFWIDYTHGGLHWAMCGPYRDTDSFRFQFSDDSKHYTNRNMSLFINSGKVDQFEGSIDIDPEKQTISIALFTIAQNQQKVPLPINGRYPLKEKH